MTLYYLAQLGLGILGIATYIAYIVKIESDKYEDSRANFNAWNYTKKNVYDFIFYLLAGLGCLTIKSIVSHYTGIEGISDYGLSYLAGLLGSFIIKLLLSKVSK